MKELAIGILDYNKKYEMARCRRLLKEMGVSQESVFKWEGTGQLKTRREEYVAFWDVLDKWEMQKAVACMSRLAENDADVLIHSHIWHAGLKSIPYRVVDSGQADMGRLLCQGLPGISAVVFSRKWLLGLLLEKEQIKIGSGEFYRLLFSALMNGRCRTELIAQQLSEHWSYYGGRTPSVKQARNDILKYWGQWMRKQGIRCFLCVMDTFWIIMGNLRQRNFSRAFLCPMMNWRSCSGHVRIGWCGSSGQRKPRQRGRMISTYLCVTG